MVAASELPINTGANATTMAQTIFGDGVTVVSASYTGDNRASGVYTEGDTYSPGVTPGDTGVMLSTGRLTSFTNSSGDSNQATNTSSNTTGENNNADFNEIAGARTYDASYLDVDFVPTTDTLSMQFVFSSEEYPEYSGSIYNDVVGVWVNGQHVDLSINFNNTSVANVNQNSNETLYVDNTGDQYNTEMDGFTVTMTLKMDVVPGQVNSVRIGIADVSDSSFDSTLIIAGNSVQGALIAEDDLITIGVGGSQTVDLLGNDSGPTGSTLIVTHINGQEVFAGDTLTLSSGHDLTLNADGTVTIDNDLDEEVVNFSYTVANGTGAGAVSDSAFVTINSIPCFVAGSLIATPSGDVPVESLRPGDRVITHDNGVQPLRWIGRREVQAEGNFAPIRISKNALGEHGDLLLSPLHRVLIRDALAELLFGEREVLVAARDLINDRTIRPQPGGTVEYVHILFDEHQVVYAEGLATESFLPGPQTTKSFEREIVDEICAIFPELNPETGAGYSTSARPTLKGYEARLLLSREVAA